MWTFVATAALLSSWAVSAVLAADTAYMNATITNYFAENRHHVTNPAYKHAAMQYVYSEFRRHGFETSYHNFTVAKFPFLVFSNVIGVLKGVNFGKARDKLIGVGAHFDTVTTTKGVDDNGSGVAAMLEVARQLTMPSSIHSGFEHTIILMAFDLQAEGYIGSDKFIMDWFPQFVQANYGAAGQQMAPYGAIIMDSLMNYNQTPNSQALPTGSEHYFPHSYHSISADTFEGDFLFLVYRANWTSGDPTLTSSFQHAWNHRGHPEYQLETFPLPFSSVEELTSFSDFLRSDHRNFWQHGYPALLLTDSAYFRGVMKQCYRHECDDLDTMLTDDNIHFLSKTADAVTKAVAALAVHVTGPAIG